MRLIDADALKRTFCAECGGTIVCDNCDIDYHFSHAPTLDPMANGQWMRYDLIVKTIRAMAAQYSIEGKQDGADALLDLADYFDQISNMIGET